MTTLVLGASGSTGKIVVEQLLNRGEKVKAIIRTTAHLPENLARHPLLELTKVDLTDLSDEQLQRHVVGCRAVVSCLGHNLTFKGVYGKPRRLVKNAVQRLCTALENTNPTEPVKFVLMNSTGNQNVKAGETVSLSQSIAIKLIRLLVPPHADNEEAAEYLQTHYEGTQKAIEWVVVRPDTLVDEALSTPYDIFNSPVRDPIFDPGTTSRVNVARFMVSLIYQTDLWQKWSMKMPAIYNREV